MKSADVRQPTANSFLYLCAPMQKVLVTEYVHHLLIHGLRDLGYHVVYAPEIAPPEVAQWLEDFEGIIVNTKTPVDAPLMERCEGLRFIGRLGVGLDIVDTDMATVRGITVINTPGANANAVGEHMFGMLLALLRHIPVAHGEVMSGLWRREKNRGEELRGKTIGIIGYGNTGSAFAAKFAGWGTQVLAYDKYKRHYAGDLRYVREVELDELQAQSDVISLHVPLTTETMYMVDETFLRKCKKGIILLNSSRGKVVDTGALACLLAEGHVAGACLDVLENEKPGSYTSEEQELFEALTQEKKVLLTPHIAGWTKASYRNIASQMLREISNLAQRENS
jgi:D-3-phosphoglycerate dehydrogenase